MNELETLAQRVEQASGPDRDLDAAIWPAVAPETYAKRRASASGLWPKGCDRAAYERTFATQNAPPYTASLDAAMLLRLPDWHLTLTTDGGCRASFHNHEWLMAGHGRNPARSLAATPALAIAAAALRATALHKGDGG